MVSTANLQGHVQVIVGQTPQERLLEAAYVDVEIGGDGFEGDILRLRDLWRGWVAGEGRGMVD